MPDNVIVSEISIKEGNTMTQNKVLTAEFLEKVLGGVSGDRALMGYDITTVPGILLTRVHNGFHG